MSRNQNLRDPPVRPPRRKRKGYISGGGTSGSEYSTSGAPIGVPGSILQRRRSIRSSIRSNRSNKSAKGRIGSGAPGTNGVHTNNFGETDHKLPPRTPLVERRPVNGPYAPEQKLRGSQITGLGGLSRSDSRRSSRRAIVAASTAAARKQYHNQVCSKTIHTQIRQLEMKFGVYTSIFTP